MGRLDLLIAHSLEYKIFTQENTIVELDRCLIEHLTQLACEIFRYVQNAQETFSSTKIINFQFYVLQEHG